MKWLLVFAFCFPAHARIRHNPAMSIDDYLVTWFREIPIEQVTVHSGELIAIHGAVEIDLLDLPPPLRKSFRDALTEVAEGRGRISGAWFDLGAATIMFREPKPVAVRYDPSESFAYPDSVPTDTELQRRVCEFQLNVKP